MCCLFYPTCPPTLPCGMGPCTHSCPDPPRCCMAGCPPPVPCTPCYPCKCTPIYRACPPPAIPDIVGPIVPVLPPCRPRRLPAPQPPMEPPPCPPCFPPVLPCCPPPEPCPPPPVCPYPEPIILQQPVLPCCNPQCPPPIIPKQRPICPRAPPAGYPCLPVCKTNCIKCDDKDVVTQRRPLIVSDSVFAERPSGYPRDCYNRRNPMVRYSVNSEQYVRQGPQAGCWYPVPVPLI